MDGDQSMIPHLEEPKTAEEPGSMSIISQTPLSHSLILGSGKRLDVKLLFDWNNWSVQDLRKSTHLDELAFNFNRIINTSTYRGLKFKPVLWNMQKVSSCVNRMVPMHTTKIEFTIKVNNTEVMIPFERYKKGIRLCIGSLLSALLNESHILYHNESKEYTDTDLFEAHPTVFITMEEKIAGLRVETVDIGTQCLKLDNGMVQILPEIYALHSPFFCSLLFGNCHTAKGEVIALRGVEVQDLRLISTFLSAFKENCYKYKFPRTNLSQIAQLYRLLDRLLIPIPISIESHLTQIVTSEFIKKQDYPIIIELSQIQSRVGRGRTNIMETFLGRFAFARCLTTFIDHYKDLITPPIFALLSKRITELVSKSYNRPKFSIKSSGGTRYVVEVPTDYDELAETAEDVQRITNQLNSSALLYMVHIGIVSSAIHDKLPFLLMDSDHFLLLREGLGKWPTFQAMVVLGHEFSPSFFGFNKITPFFYQ